MKDTRFKPIPASQYVCHTWFERDRAHIRLETPKGRTVFELWDGEVAEAIQNRDLTTPRGFNPARLPGSAWQPHAVAYAVDQGLITLP